MSSWKNMQSLIILKQKKTTETLVLKSFVEDSNSASEMQHMHKLDYF